MQYHPGNPRIKATLQRTMSKPEPKAQAPDDVPAPGASEKPKLGATRKPTRNPTRKPTPSPTTKKPTKAATKKPWKGWTANRGFLENARKVLTTSRARKPDAIAAAIVSLGEAIEHAGGGETGASCCAVDACSLVLMLDPRLAGLTGPTSRFKVKANETRMHVVTTTFNSKSPARAREYAEVRMQDPAIQTLQLLDHVLVISKGPSGQLQARTPRVGPTHSCWCRSWVGCCTIAMSVWCTPSRKRQKDRTRRSSTLLANRNTRIAST